MKVTIALTLHYVVVLQRNQEQLQLQLRLQLLLQPKNWTTFSSSRSPRLHTSLRVSQTA